MSLPHLVHTIPEGVPSVISHFSRCHESIVEAEPQVDRRGFAAVVRKGVLKSSLDNRLSVFLSSLRCGLALKSLTALPEV